MIASGEKLLTRIVTFVVPVALLLIAANVVRPWGNFPINDDWQYAHIADVFARTNEIKIDRPIAPALVVQTVVGGALLKLTGMSHVALRALTLALSILGLAILNAILKHAEVRALHRAALLLLVAFNPLGFVFSLSFMTEVYGTVPALAAAWIWLRGKDEEPPTITRAIVATLFAAIAYLTRQFSGLILPSLVFASALALLGKGERRPRTFAPHAIALFLFTCICATHWIWNKASQNETAQLAGPMSMVLQPKGTTYPIMGGLALLYLTGFVAPLFPLLPVPKLRRLALPMGLLVFGVLGFAWGLDHYHSRFAQPHFTFDKTMPYLTNVIAPGGIGPYTTIDLYLQKGPKAPYLPAWVWTTVGRVLFALVVLLPIPCFALLSAKKLGWRRWTLCLTGLTFAALSLGATLQVYGLDLFDRYLWTVFVGLVMALAAVMPTELSRPGPRFLFGIILWLPLATLSIGGTHDYFQWQRVRNNFYQGLLNDGISPLSIDAGYELNGWYAFDGWMRGDPSPSCVSACRADVGSWYVRDSSYRISSTPRRGEIIVGRNQARTWLARQPAVFLTRRADP